MTASRIDPMRRVARWLLLMLALVSGASAWARGDDDNWQVLHARYGTADRNMDVTGRLKELARRDERVRVTNGLFGNDPAIGQVKVLRIYARSRSGENRTFEYREGSIIDGAIFTDWRGGGWGQNGWDHGWDGPRPGHGGGNGGGYGNNGDDGGWQILQARYGTSDRNMDVTGRLKELARSDERVRVRNELFGNDPAVGQTKMLRIFARGRNGEQRTFEFKEGSWIDGSQFTGWGRGNWGDSGWNGGWDGRPGRPGNDGGRPGYDQGLNIVRATYGTGLRQMDVTQRIRDLSRSGRLDVRVSNDLFGRDPATGSRKLLQVTYTQGRSEERQSQAWEGDQLRLP